MKITQRQLRQIIKEELMREMRHHRHAAHSPASMGHGPGDSFLDHPPEDIPDMGDQYDPSYYEGLDDEEPDEPMGLPAGVIMNRMRR